MTSHSINNRNYKAFVTGNISAKFLSNPFFKAWVEKLRPAYKLPSQKHSFPKVLLPKEYNRAKAQVFFCKINQVDPEKSGRRKSEFCRFSFAVD
jgi:hypothetical protein